MTPLRSALLALAAGFAAAAVAVGFTTGAPSAEPGKRGGFPPPPHGSPAEVWAVGDGADGSDRSKALAGEIESNDPDRFLYLGDVYEYGTAWQFDNNYALAYGRFDSIAAPTPGNHEWGNRESGYYPYWEDATGAGSIPPWYSLEVAGWQVLSLNSEAPHSRDSDQLRWLRQQISNTPKFGTCRIAFWHRPRYDAGVHTDAVDTDPFWDALANRARVVLNGHDHNMQRFRPKRGIMEFISGAASHEPYGVDAGDHRLRFQNDSTPGALRLRIRPNRLRFAFVSAGGVVLDSGRRRCQR